MEENAFLYMTKILNYIFRCRWLRKIKIMILGVELDEDDYGGGEFDD